MPRRSQPTSAKAVPKQKFTKEKFHKLIFGTKEQEGLGKQVIVYILLISIGFVYLYPILYMISRSFMTRADLLDSSITWLPSSFHVKNYLDAFAGMDFLNAFKGSILLSLIPTLLNVVMCGIIGYGFARFNFPGKNIMMGILIFTMILPQQVVMTPNYRLYNQLGILESINSLVLPSFLGQGIKAQLYILIFWQFFRQIPNVLFEAAKIDGCGYMKSFIRIGIPSAAPAILVVFLFSFVWYWNESYLIKLFVMGVSSTSGNTWNTLVIALSTFNDSYASSSTVSGEALTSLNEAIQMAATVLCVGPILIMYMFLQKYFVESIDNAGITGE